MILDLDTFLYRLMFALPGASVSLVGMTLALVLWQRHPRVSGVLLASLAIWMLARIGFLVGWGYAWEQYELSRIDGDSVTTCWASLFAMNRLALAAAWMAILVAVFGWRQNDKPELGPVPPAFQFNVRELMVLILTIAILLPVFRGVGGAHRQQLQWVFAFNIPMVLCWLVGVRNSLVRWPWNPGVSKLVVAGTTVVATTYVLLQIYEIWTLPVAISDDAPPPVFTIFDFTFFFAFADAIGWGIMILAVLGWRRAPHSTLPQR